MIWCDDTRCDTWRDVKCDVKCEYMMREDPLRLAFDVSGRDETHGRETGVGELQRHGLALGVDQPKEAVPGPEQHQDT